MKGIDETTFGGDAKITKAELSQALNKISGSYFVNESNDEVTKIQLMNDLYKVNGSDIIGFFKHIISLVELLFSGSSVAMMSQALL